MRQIENTLISIIKVILEAKYSFISIIYIYLFFGTFVIFFKDHKSVFIILNIVLFLLNIVFISLQFHYDITSKKSIFKHLNFYLNILTAIILALLFIFLLNAEKNNIKSIFNNYINIIEISMFVQVIPTIFYNDFFNKAEPSFITLEKFKIYDYLCCNFNDFKISEVTDLIYKNNNFFKSKNPNYISHEYNHITHCSYVNKWHIFF